MHRDTGHGNGIAAGFTTCCQSDVQQLGGALGVIVEQLIEITHAVKQQDVRVLGLDAKVLLHHRGMGGSGGCHGGIVYNTVIGFVGADRVREQANN